MPFEFGTEDTVQPEQRFGGNTPVSHAEREQETLKIRADARGCGTHYTSTLETVKS